MVDDGICRSVYKCVYTHINVCRCVYIYIHKHICIHIYIHVYTFIHTHVVHNVDRWSNGTSAVGLFATVFESSNPKAVDPLGLWALRATGRLEPAVQQTSILKPEQQSAPINASELWPKLPI